MNRYKATHKASLYGIVGNIVLLFIKGIVGFASNSQAMIADFFNSFGDVLSSFMTFVGNKISSKEADEDHHLGHGKAEYIYSFLISIIMLLTALTVMKDTIMTYINKDTITFSYWLILVCIITIIVKFCLFLYTNYLYKKYDNILIEANSKDHRNDCFITSFTLLSSICGLYGFRLLDIIFGLGIALWMAITAIRIFKESYDVLMDKAISQELKDRVYEIIKKHEEIKRVIHFNSTPIGYKYQISFTIYVDGNMSTFESHNIADSLEKEIDKKIDEIYLTVVHVNPMKIDKD